MAWRAGKLAVLKRTRGELEMQIDHATEKLKKCNADIKKIKSEISQAERFPTTAQIRRRAGLGLLDTSLPVPEERRPASPPDDPLQPGLEPYFETDKPEKLYLKQEVARTEDGRLGLTAHFSMIVKIAGLWYEIWCPYCGVNATKGYKIHFLRGIPGLKKHMKAKHLWKLPNPDWGKLLSDEETLKCCGKALMYAEDLEELVSGEYVPRLVHVGRSVHGWGAMDTEPDEQELRRRRKEDLPR